MKETRSARQLADKEAPVRARRGDHGLRRVEADVVDGARVARQSVLERGGLGVPDVGGSFFFFEEGVERKGWRGREREKINEFFSSIFCSNEAKREGKKTSQRPNSPSDDPAATRAPPSSLDQQHRSRLRSSECAAPTNAREHLSAGANGRTSQQRSVPSLELESRCVGAALGEAPGLSAREVTVSECPTSVSEGFEVLRRSLFLKKKKKNGRRRRRRRCGHEKFRCWCRARRKRKRKSKNSPRADDVVDPCGVRHVCGWVDGAGQQRESSGRLPCPPALPLPASPLSPPLPRLVVVVVIVVVVLLLFFPFFFDLSEPCHRPSHAHVPHPL